MNGTILRATDLTIGYAPNRKNRLVVAENLSLALRDGEVVCLIGPNGSGKSTLLRTLAGLQAPLGGRIFLKDKEVSSFLPRDLARQIGVVLTEQVSPGLLSVFDLAALGRYSYTDWLGNLRTEDKNIVHWALKAVGAENLVHRRVIELSDGERQKVMIARALAQEPRLIILDEPTAFLDLPRRVEIMALLRKLARETGRSILLSTHDLELALRSADRIWLLSLFTGGAKLQTGAPEDLVLSGAVEETFKNEGVEFDRRHGSFVITRSKKENVSLAGHGLGAIWTKRALEREGFLVNKTGAAASIRVEVTANKGKISWKLICPAGESEHSTIYELIGQLTRSAAGYRSSHSPVSPP